MQRALIVTGIMSVGTALVFGAAALTAYLVPNGATVAAGWNGSVMVQDRGVMVAPVPMKGPVFVPDPGGAFATAPPDAVAN
jgi:hypothetical protein